MQNKYHVFFAGDDNYIKYIAVTITSIIMNIKKNDKKANDEEFVFHILTDGVSEQNQIKINQLNDELDKVFPTKIEVHTFSGKDFTAFPKWRNNYLTYYRFYFLETITESVEKILYLDADIIVNCDLREFFELDIQGKVLAAAGLEKEVTFPSIKGKQAFHYKGIYFNAGVLLINVHLWRKLEIKDKAIDFLQNYHVTLNDQDALNAVVDNNYLPISHCWNLHSPALVYHIEKLNHINDEKEIINIIQNDATVKIIHYASRKKPWASIGFQIIKNKPTMSNIPSFIYWWHYAELCTPFKEDLHAVKSSPAYIKAVKKEQKTINFINKGKVFKQIYCLKLKWESIYSPIRRSIEKPFKIIRSKKRANSYN